MVSIKEYERVHITNHDHYHDVTLHAKTLQRTQGISSKLLYRFWNIKVESKFWNIFQGTKLILVDLESRTKGKLLEVIMKNNKVKWKI